MVYQPKDKRRGLLIAFAIALVAVAALLFVLSLSRSVTAETVVGYVSFSDATLDGTNVYTSSQTATSSALLSANFAEVELHSTAAISGTGNMTVSLQFYNGPLGCSAATGWYTAEHVGYYVSQTASTTPAQYYNSGLTEASVAKTLVHTADGSKGRVWEIEGKCLRFSIAGSTNFTPTIKGRMVNTR